MQRWFHFRFVVVSDAHRKPMQPQPLSRLVRIALDEVGQPEVTPKQLRYDFVVRQLELHDWQFVSRISGLESASLSTLAPYSSDGTLSTRVNAEDKPPKLNEPALRKVLASEGTSAAGLTMRLVWDAGLRTMDVAALTWDRVDLDHGEIAVDQSPVSIPPELLTLLQALRKTDPQSKPVLHSKTGTPYEPDRLSRLVRNRLVQAGLDNVSLLDLSQDFRQKRQGRDKILAYAETHDGITRNEVMDLCHISKAKAYNLLGDLIQRGDLVHIGHHYHIPGTVIAPEDQYDAIRTYLQTAGTASRRDLANLLQIPPRPCVVILRHMIADGKLILESHKYRLPH